MSSSFDVTWTLSAVAVPGVGEGEAAGVVVEVELDAEVEVAVVVEAAGVETASCAVMILVIKRIALNVIGNFFIKLFVDLIFKVVIGCGVRDSGEAR
jgi:hypothetical protein